MIIPDGLFLAIWPPGFPLLFAFWGFMGVPMTIGAGLMNAVSVAGVVLIGSQLAHILTGNKALTRFVAFALALGLPIAKLLVKVWSDGLFLLLVTSFLAFAPSVLESSRKSALPLWILLAVGATMLRYAGITLIITGVILLCMNRSNWKEGMRRMFMFGSASTLPITLWMARNVLVLGTSPTGPGPKASPMIAAALSNPIATIESWILAGHGQPLRRCLLA